MTQAQIMKQNFQNLCSYSGQKVNTTKSKLLVSKNAKKCTARLLSIKFEKYPTHIGLRKIS